MEPTTGGIIFLTIITLPAIVAVLLVSARLLLDLAKVIFLDDGPHYGGISSGSFVTHNYSNQRQVKEWRYR